MNSNEPKKPVSRKTVGRATKASAKTGGEVKRAGDAYSSVSGRFGFSSASSSTAQKADVHARKPVRRAANGRRKPTAKRRKPVSKKKSGQKEVALNLYWMLGIALGLVLLLAIPIIRNQASDTGVRLPQGAWSYGIDISHHNSHRIVWDSLRIMTDISGRTVRDKRKAMNIRKIDFIYIKATEGEQMVDKSFADNWKSAKEAGIRRGAYHFFRTSKDPVKQAQNFMTTMGPLSSDDLPPVLDIETVHRGITKDALNASLKKFLDIIEAEYGVKPVIYSSDSFIRDWLSPTLTSAYPIWAARYSTSQPKFPSWTIWQFSDDAVIYGIEKKTDLNVRRVD